MIATRRIARASFGAGIGVVLTGLLSGLILSRGPHLMLIPAMGASGVLLFAAPETSFAQPRAVIGGNFIAVITGLAALHVTSQPTLAVSLALVTTIAVSALCGCIHPPSGGVALMVVLGGPGALLADNRITIMAVLLNSVLLVLLAFVWNKITGTPYPHPNGRWLADRSRM